MNGVTAQILTVASAIVGVAVIATLVSRNSNTSGVITAAGGAFGNAIRAATGPVTGNNLGRNANV